MVSINDERTDESLLSENQQEDKCWFVLRDLKRPNAKMPAYRLLDHPPFEVFTPLHWVLQEQRGKRIRVQKPYIPDLLFVRARREDLDPIVAKTDTLQYRYIRGAYCEPMRVAEPDMNRFILATKATENPRYYAPEEITPAMFGRTIRIEGGPLDGCEGTLLTTRGSRTKRLLVSLPALLSVAAEVSPEYIRFL